jgi:predicted amidohydrolase
MEVAVAVAQTPVTWDIGQNLAGLTACLADARPGEVVVFPEACLSDWYLSQRRTDLLGLRYQLG